MRIRAQLPPRGRDYRLDLLRGFANWAIYVDHIPNNAVNWLTQRNFGFSDAADLFVFISGYTASFVYARIMLERGLRHLVNSSHQASVANLRGAYCPVRDVHRRDRISCASLRRSESRA
jgi:OpgC protein